MITTIIAILCKLGIGILVGAAIYVAILTLGWVIDKVKTFFKKKRSTVAIIATQKLVQEIVAEKERNNDVTSLEELERQLAKEGLLDENGNAKNGIIMTGLDKDNNLDKDDIIIVKADSLDEPLQRNLNKAKDGVLVIKEKTA